MQLLVLASLGGLWWKRGSLHPAGVAKAGRADCCHDTRYRALVLLATFASLRWGEVIALRRCDLDLDRRTVRVHAAYAERSTGELLLGPPKSRAGDVSSAFLA